MKIYITIIITFLIINTAFGQIDNSKCVNDIITDILNSPYTYEKFQRDSVDIIEAEKDSLIALFRIETLKRSIQIPEDKTIYPFGIPLKKLIIQSYLNDFSDTTFFNNEYSIQSTDPMNFPIQLFSDSYAYWTSYKVDSFLRLNNESKWRDLEKDGILIIHKPALNDDKTKAIFEYQFRCGRMCGYHFTCFLYKTNGKWEQEICETVIW